PPMPVTPVSLPRSTPVPPRLGVFTAVRLVCFVAKTNKPANPLKSRLGSECDSNGLARPPAIDHRHARVPAHHRPSTTHLLGVQHTPLVDNHSSQQGHEYSHSSISPLMSALSTPPISNNKN